MSLKIISKVDMPRGFYVKTGMPAKTIGRLGDFDKSDQEVLSSYGLKAVSFNFFVKWNTEKCTDGIVIPEAWIKRYVSLEEIEHVSIDDIKNSDVEEKLVALEGKKHIIDTAIFMNKIGFKCRYLMLFNKPYSDDATNDTALVGFFLDYDPEKDGFMYEFLSLEHLKELIKDHTGVPMKKGKDITVADTYLEAYLKPTRTPFPGDCDELIFSSKGAEYLVEYKKCTKKDEKSVVNQSFMRFIENRDRIKYTRINILRNYICGIMGKEIPLINVLFSVEEDDKKIKLENIKNNLQPGKAFTYDVANTPKENKQKFYKYLNRVVD